MSRGLRRTGKTTLTGMVRYAEDCGDVDADL